MIYFIYGRKMWIFSTMWVLTPIGLMVLVYLIKQINKENQRIDEEWIEYYKSNGITPPENLKNMRGVEPLKYLEDMRGGQQDPDVPQDPVVPQDWVLVNATKPGFMCLIQTGVRYVKNKKYTQLVVKHFRHKAKYGVIFITKSALCQLIVLDELTYGSGFMTAVGLSSWVNPARNAVSISTAVYGGYLIYKAFRSKMVGGLSAKQFYANRRITLIGASVSLLVSLISMFWGRDPGIVYIASRYVAIDGKVVSEMKSRIPELPDVVSLNMRNTDQSLVVKIKNRIPEKICKIPGVTKIWKKCSPKVTVINPELGLDYDGVVNMADVVHLSMDDMETFNDVLDMGTPNFSEAASEHVSEVVSESPKIKVTGSKTAKLKGKVVRFLDKFSDPEIIPEDSQWDINEAKNSLVKEGIKNKK